MSSAARSASRSSKFRAAGVEVGLGDLLLLSHAAIFTCSSSMRRDRSSRLSASSSPVPSANLNDPSRTYKSSVAIVCRWLAVWAMITSPTRSGGGAVVLPSPSVSPDPTTIAVSSGTTSAIRLASPRPTAASATTTSAPCFLSDANASRTTSAAGLAGASPPPPAAPTPMKPTFTPLTSRSVTVPLPSFGGGATSPSRNAPPDSAVSFASSGAPAAQSFLPGANPAKPRA